MCVYDGPVFCECNTHTGKNVLRPLFLDCFCAEMEGGCWRHWGGLSHLDTEISELWWMLGVCSWLGGVGVGVEGSG